MDLLITLFIFFVLLCCIVYKAKIYPDTNPNFFDVENTNALRGLWSIIVIMVHIPAAYGNIIQDAAGSFANVGVTFFFMLSGYGLTASLQHRGALQKNFWKRRLLKLLIPQLLLNIASVLLFHLLFGDKIQFLSIVWISRWLTWLLVCYLIFWSMHKLIPDFKWANAAIAILIVAFSVAQYCLKYFGVIEATIWSTEIYGFLWGIILAAFYPQIKHLANRHWLLKTVLICIAAILMGITYLKYKTIVFWGDYLLRIALACVIIIFLLLLNMRISVGNRALRLLGSISFELYLSHTAVINAIERGIPAARSGLFILMVLIGASIMSAFVHAISAYVFRKINLR